MHRRIVIIGIDGLGYKYFTSMFKNYMPNLARLADEYGLYVIDVETAISPRNWVKIFAGKDLPWYNLYIKRVRDDQWRLIRYDELGVKFIWDFFPQIIYINVPVVLPPVSNVSDFRPVAYGLPYTFFEAWREINTVRFCARKYLEQDRDVICCFTWVDRYLHINRPNMSLYRLLHEMDEVIRQLVELATDFIIVSDHGMKLVRNEPAGEIKPRHDMPYIRTVTKAIHDHDTDALFISSLKVRPQRLEDVFTIMLNYFKTKYH